MSSDEQVQWVKDAKKDAAKRNHESALRATAVTKRAVVKGIFEAQKDVDWDDELVEKIVATTVENELMNLRRCERLHNYRQNQVVHIAEMDDEKDNV
ncbi:hypothetical protein BCR33DRAFT_789343 [Rhizoclosmatium globosum]|uniref:Uncharacterized protein n=1 Tax=Rhizoclosmatium globosum TaxID=329046 RepID=A0A1Y2BT40_9FUNG|nr:hypothetical protein BCR33DRAFT_789343 [Rhizoclosmatium globosum]|eukprot:ORY37928.1 hypothetical protein BCR33DRAFT_789343 [Rhizoclosmatium globosum]